MEKRPTHAVIDIGALRFNYLQIKTLIASGTKVMAIVKANAYGHGDVDAASTFESMGCDFFGVAVAEEGARLRNSGVKKPIVVLGGIFPNQIKGAFALGLTPVLFDLNTASLFNEFAMKDGSVKDVHVKIDTGMGRLGIRPEDADRFFREFTDFKHLRLEGLCSHFSSADEVDREFTDRQLALFRKTVKTANDLGIQPEYLHMANSAAIVEFKESHFNLVRPGLMLYGAYPAERMCGKVELKPVMRLSTRILQLKNVPAGTPVGYGRTFVTSKASVIATLPIGYGDGLMRSLSNKGHVIVNGRTVPLVGTVCMDLAMCDVTHVEGVREGDEAVFLGGQGSVEIAVEEMAKKAGTISYEIFCSIGPRVPRIYV
ncbi:MAG: alanine racemase [Deltaproteobacteria bacterium]|nr:alanine racemase [Deltaproteobacteria bacterium]